MLPQEQTCRKETQDQNSGYTLTNTHDSSLQGGGGGGGGGGRYKIFFDERGQYLEPKM